MKNNDLEKYKTLSIIRNQLALVKQLSWSISQQEKKFPLEEVDSDDYSVMLETYIEQINQLRQILINLDKILDKNSANKTKDQEE